ncbi:carbonyl reductase [NADPH] 1 [Aethina tumida]|uniref:carbonyl reductase [NADPH] 1 n=1 Tax=Aethina tumida TaxID=116153 RepID=UPI002147D69E|nr:carbonyl reductase [NADPH] 1 [Aethina tumida]
MSESQKVAVVTGANKGIGYEIVKGLCKKFNGVVYLTARNAAKGESAVQQLKLEGLNPKFHQLDITSQDSVDTFKEYIKTTYGGLDLLVNNAAICYLKTATEPFGEQAENTFAVNYFGTLRLCDALFPLLRNNAKVVNVSSSAGHLTRIPSDRRKADLGDPTLTVEKLNALVKQFLKDAKNGKNVEEGWGNNSYAVSKVSLTALTFIQQRSFNSEVPNRNISVNAVHPGYINTDINGHHGPHSASKGAEAPLFVALEADFKGKYVWSDSKVLDWYSKTAPRNV